MNKRGEGLSMTVIVVAAVALLVLVVLIMIFTGRMNITTKALGTCESYSGRCVASCDELNQNEGGGEQIYTRSIQYVCRDDGINGKINANQCCVRVQGV